MDLDPFFTECLDCMDRAVIKFYPLSDPDWTGTEDKNFFWYRWELSHIRFPCGIEIGSSCGEFCGTGIDHLVGGKTSNFFNLVR